MDTHMKKNISWTTLRTGLLTAAAIMLVMSAVMGSAWAYFTTYTRAKGGYVLRLGHEEHDDEEFSQWNKEIKISLSEDSKPVYLRARAFCADYSLTYSDVKIDQEDQPVNNNWVQIGDWMYYTEIYSPEKDNEGNIIPAKSLFVRINNVPQDEMAGIMKGDEFNVIIIYEAAEVQYDENGKMLPYDSEVVWKKTVQTGRTEASGSKFYEYVANTNTKKYHLPTCPDVNEMERQHRWYVDVSKDELEAQGYEPCKNCNP